MFKVKVLASGSNGNSIFIEGYNTKILIDAGLSGKFIENKLKELNVDPSELSGILVSHEHKDHVTGVGVFSRRYDIPVYATGRTWEQLKSMIGEIKHQNERELHKGGFELNDIYVAPFPVSHDAVDPVGFNLMVNNIKISIATDCGVFSSVMKDRLKGSNCLIIESNHDPELLKKGPYPLFLKKRIRSVKGHLSNYDLAEKLGDIITSNTDNIILAHLSEENNNPDLAFNCIKDSMVFNGISAGETNLMVADRRNGTSLIQV